MNPLCHFRMERVVDGSRVDTLVVFLAADALPGDSFSALVDREVDRDLVPDELVLVVRESVRAGVAAALRSASELDLARARLDRATVTIVGFDAKGREATGSRAVVLGLGAASAMTLMEVGRRCATAAFNCHGGFVEASTRYHFRNPSGRHTDRFMRLSNLIVRQAEISLLAMTLLPLVPNDAVEAHVDTPALFAVVAAINDHYRSLDSRRAPLRCDSFRSYVEVDTHEFLSASPIVVLISASSSGGLAAKIVVRGVSAGSIAHLLYLGGPTHSLNVAVDLSRDPVTNPDGVAERRATYDGPDCALCNAGSIAVELHGDQFDLGGPEFEPVTVKKDDAPKLLGATMKRLAGSGALGVSLATGYSAKLFRVDPARLIAAPAFSERLDYVAKRHVPAGVRECIYLDDASQPFAVDALARAGAHASLISRNDMDALQPDGRDGTGAPLNGAPILVAAAVVESGRSLLDVSRDLRSVRPASPQIYLVGLHKHASPERREEFERTLVQTPRPSRHELAAVEALLLPPGGSANPWVAERDFLDEASTGGFALSEALEARRTALRFASLPLTDTLFVATGEAPLALQPGFVFWPGDRPFPGHSQADVFYTISSVLQKLRADPGQSGGRALRTTWFQHTLLDPANLGRFNDGIIQASLLRAARPAEIDYSGESGEILDAARVVGRIVAGAHRPRGEAACEVLVALGTRRLRLPRGTLDEVLRPTSIHPPLVAELVRLCRRALL